MPEVTMETLFAGELQVAIHGLGRMYVTCSEEQPLYVFAAEAFFAMKSFANANPSLKREEISNSSSWRIISCHLNGDLGDFKTLQVQKLFGPKGRYD
jgi:hypothetical protein